MPEITKRCEVKMQNGKPCGRELYDDECCIFHSKKENKDLNVFHGELYQIFGDKSLKTHDLTSFVFPEGVVFLKRFPKPVTFVGAVFKSNADFSNVTFEGEAVFARAKFKREANFLGATFWDRSLFPQSEFDGAANFSGTSFKQRADFLFAKFTGPVSFWKATFGGGAGFDRTEIMNEADFGHSRFKDSVEFLGTIFHDKAKFGVAHFNAESNFASSTFKGNVDFQAVTFVGQVYFLRTAFEGEADFCGALFKGALRINPERVDRKSFYQISDFRTVGFLTPEKVEFQKIDLSKISFLETDVRKVHFTDVGWYKERGRGRNKVFDEVSPDPKTKKFDYQLIAQLYRRLRANYEENLRYPEAGDFYIGEMEMTRKAEKNILRKLPLLIYKAISKYGESYYRPLCWILAILMFFPMLFMIAGIQSIDIDPSNPTQDMINYKWDLSSIKSVLPDIQKIADYRTSFLYTMSVFSLVRDKKYTTINKSGYALFLAESILTPVFLAFFLLALRRRFKR